jgi:hypothetical protein
MAGRFWWVVARAVGNLILLVTTVISAYQGQHKPRNNFKRLK